MTTATTELIFGGAHRWQGKALRVVNYKDGGVCASLPRQESKLVKSFQAKEESEYEIVIYAAKTRGDGGILVGFGCANVGNEDWIKINILSEDIKKYSVKVQTRLFNNPKLTAFYLERSPNSSGNVFIREVYVNFIKESYVGLTEAEKEMERVKQMEIMKARQNEAFKRFEEHLGKRKLKSLARLRPPPVIKPKPNVHSGSIVEQPALQNSIYENNLPIDNLEISEEIRKVLVTIPQDLPKVSILTPTYNCLEHTKRCYNAIRRHTAFPHWEWIIADSASEDDTVDFFDIQGDPRVTMIERGKKDGNLAQIYNELAAAADGDYLMFLHNDCEPQPFWLFQMMFKIMRQKEVGVVGPRLIRPDQKTDGSAVVFADAEITSHEVFSEDFYDKDRYFQAIGSACFLIKKEDFEAVGGFDEELHFYGEAEDLCLRVAQKLNKKTIYSAHARVNHYGSATRSSLKITPMVYARSVGLFAERWENIYRDINRYMQDPDYNVITPDIAFVSCVNHVVQYVRYVWGSLVHSNTDKIIEIVPIYNIKNHLENKYYAAQALNMGIRQANAPIVVACHQDVMYYNFWVDLLYERINAIERQNPNWGVLGTAGISPGNQVLGFVCAMNGKMQWPYKDSGDFSEVQTLDEQCLIIKKSSGLMFDEKTFKDFYFFGPDLCLQAKSKDLGVFFVNCPIIHSRSTTISSRLCKKTFLNQLNIFATKWKGKFSHIRTTTSEVKPNEVKTYMDFEAIF